MHRRVPLRVWGIPPGVSSCLARVPASISAQSMNSVVGFPQAALLASYGDIDPAGVLRSTGVTPLRRYYDPLRPPTTPHSGYCFPSWVVSPPCPGRVTPGRVSQVSRLIFRRPLSPTTPESPTDACARCFAAGFRLRLIWKVGHSHLCNEAATGSLALRLTSPPSRAPTARSPEPPPGWLHGGRAIPMVSTFQLTRSTRLA